MTNQVILARRMNLNPNDSVKWSLMKFTNSKRFLNGPAVSSNHTSYLSINLHNPKFYLRNFYRCFTQKVYILMSNHSLFEWKPCFYLCCVGTGTGYLPLVHTNHSDTPEAWIGNSVSYLNWTQILHKYLHTLSNITQIFTHFLQVLMVYKKVYKVSPKYQENWNKEHPINNQEKQSSF